MSDPIQISAQPRDSIGTRPSRRLRRQQLVPGIIYGGRGKPLPVSIQLSVLQRAMQEESFYTSILEIKAGEKTERAVLKALDQHPVRNEPLHVDFLRATERTYVTLPVPIRLANEGDCIGVREGGGVITHQLTQITVYVRASNIPDYLEVDMTEVALSQPVHLSAVPLPEGVRIPSLEQGQDPSVVIVLPPRIMKEEEDMPEAEGDEAAEGEEPAGEADADSDSEESGS